MKKIIGVAIISCVLVLVGVVAFKVRNKLNSEAAVEKKISRLPSFEFTMLNGQTFERSNIKEQKVIVNYFNPECEHCQHMAQMYRQHASALNDMQILMVTIADSATVKRFKEDYKLDSIPTIILLLDKKRTFSNIFGTTKLPSFFIYKNMNLVKRFYGETKIENLLEN